MRFLVPKAGLYQRGLLKSLKTWAISFRTNGHAQLASQFSLLLVSPFLLCLPLFLTLE
jgi:hypothetical protein